MIRVLSASPTGMQAVKLHMACQDDRHLFSATFKTAISALIAAKLILRKMSGRYVYYTITLRGRTTLAQLNDHLLVSVQEQLAKLKPS